MMVWTIEAALASRYIDRVILSSDDDEIIQAAMAYGCEVPFKRPVELATDEARTIDVVLHAIENIGDNYDYVVLLQATSPLRTVADIDRCISMCVERDTPSVVSMSEVENSPYWMYTMNENNQLSPILNSDKRPTRRQDSGNIYQLNGAVYVNEVEQLVRDRSFVTDSTLAYIMPAEASIDIDTELDLMVLEKLMAVSAAKNMKVE